MDDKRLVRWVLVSGFVLWLAGTEVARGADAATEQRRAPRAITALEPEEAGQDFLVQGEYAGELPARDRSAHKLGAQVIALGGGTFRAVFLSGGLPGAGWDGETRIEIPGKTEGDKTIFGAADAAGYSATIADGRMSGQTDDGTEFALTRIVRESPTLGAKPPAGAIVLFDGTNTDAWEPGRKDERNLLASGARTRQSFRDFTLHVEFRTPFRPFARGQGRGNSGVYLQDRYEVQVLDSFGLQGLDNECGGIYKVARPRVNMCLPPLSWQTYEIEFKAARFDEQGKKTANAVITVKHNGVIIHENQEIPRPTGGGKPESPEPGPIYLQAHGNPVFYRNIWILEHK
jgi:hypothetical protein